MIVCSQSFEEIWARQYWIGTFPDKLERYRRLRRTLALVNSRKRDDRRVRIGNEQKRETKSSSSPLEIQAERAAYQKIRDDADEKPTNLTRRRGKSASSKRRKASRTYFEDRVPSRSEKTEFVYGVELKTGRERTLSRVGKKDTSIVGKLTNW